MRTFYIKTELQKIHTSGSIYVLTLATSILIAMMSIAAITYNRLTIQSSYFPKAEDQARYILDHAISTFLEKINADSNWQTNLGGDWQTLWETSDQGVWFRLTDPYGQTLDNNETQIVWLWLWAESGKTRIFERWTITPQKQIALKPSGIPIGVHEAPDLVPSMWPNASEGKKKVVKKGTPHSGTDYLLIQKRSGPWSTVQYELPLYTNLNHIIGIHIQLAQRLAIEDNDDNDDSITSDRLLIGTLMTIGDNEYRNATTASTALTSEWRIVDTVFYFKKWETVDKLVLEVATAYTNTNFEIDSIEIQWVESQTTWVTNPNTRIALPNADYFPANGTDNTSIINAIKHPREAKVQPSLTTENKTSQGPI